MKNYTCLWKKMSYRSLIHNHWASSLLHTELVSQFSCSHMYGSWSNLNHFLIPSLSIIHPLLFLSCWQDQFIDSWLRKGIATVTRAKLLVLFQQNFRWSPVWFVGVHNVSVIECPQNPMNWSQRTGVWRLSKVHLKEVHRGLVTNIRVPWEKPTRKVAKVWPRSIMRFNIHHLRTRTLTEAMLW